MKYNKPQDDWKKIVDEYAKTYRRVLNLIQLIYIDTVCNDKK